MPESTGEEEELPASYQNQALGISGLFPSSPIEKKVEVDYGETTVSFQLAMKLTGMSIFELSNRLYLYNNAEYLSI